MKYINSKELIGYLSDISEDPRYQDNISKFTEEEMFFIVQLIFQKKKAYKYLPITLADFLSQKCFSGMSPSNGPMLRRLKFFQHFLRTKKAKDAAILAGYSQKCAKQQGYRVLRWINKQFA